MTANFPLLQEMVDCMCAMEVHLVPDSPDGMREMLGMTQNILLDLGAEEALLRRFHTLQHDILYELSSSLPLRYAIFRDGATAQFLVLGPCREETESNLNQLSLPHRLSHEQYRRLLGFCAQQPIVPYEKWHRLAVLLIQLLFQKVAPIPFKQLTIQWDNSISQKFLRNEPFEEIDHIRSIEQRYEASSALTEAVKQGNLSLAYRYIQKMNHYAEEFSRTQDTLRNAKNLCIILNTQLRHAMEDVTLSPYRLDQVSSAIAIEIEKHRSLTSINNYWREIIRQYCELVHEQEQQKLGKLIRLTVTYIKAHLSDTLTVKDTASALLVHPDYLSAQFHREMGVSFIAYVNQERIRQAASLLQHTGIPIQQIASDVGYNNTSYFAKQFMRVMHLSPTAYRKQYREELRRG